MSHEKDRDVVVSHVVALTVLIVVGGPNETAAPGLGCPAGVAPWCG